MEQKGVLGPLYEDMLKAEVAVLGSDVAYGPVELVDLLLGSGDKIAADCFDTKERLDFSIEAIRLLRRLIESSGDDALRISLLDALRESRLMDSLVCDFERSDLGESAADLDFIVCSMGMRDKELCSLSPAEATLIFGREPSSCSVSVVIPVYNAAPYLHDTLTSLLNQELGDIEILCIDDGSTDASREILAELAAQDGRIRVYSQPHSGQSLAKNNGLKAAAGEYVYFFDADDILKSHALAIMYEKAREERLDIVYCDGESFYETDELREDHPWFETAYRRKGAYGGVWVGADLIAAFHRNNDDYVPSWLSLYRRGFLKSNGLSYHVGIIHEDAAFFFLTGLLARRTAHCPDSLVMRRIRSGSVMTRAVSFNNVYSYYQCALDMMRGYFRRESELSKAARCSLKSFMFRALRTAANHFKKLPEDEWAAAYGLEEDYSGLLMSVKGPSDIAKSLDAAKRELGSTRNRLEAANVDLTRNAAQLETLKAQCSSLEQQLNDASKKLKNASAAAARAEDEVRRLKSTWSYRVGRALVRPFGKMKSLLRSRASRF